MFDQVTAQLSEGFWLRTQAENHRARRFYERRGMMLDHIEGETGVERAVYVMRRST
ncbi:hypothetical protein ABID41_003794 [Phenylobacterium koreense]|uniref:N-acetyltransferase domain-containing protein n=1 Tax=Phenylobacterium koreense TaxID=266125 RepID=A0ABV2ENN8_9CAUL